MPLILFLDEISHQNSTDTDLVDTISEYLSQKKEKAPETTIIDNKTITQEEVEVLKEITEHLNDLQTVPKKAEEENLKTPPPSPAEVLETNNSVEKEKCDVSKGKKFFFYRFKKSETQLLFLCKLLLCLVVLLLTNRILYQYLLSGSLVKPNKIVVSVACMFLLV